MLRRLAPCLLAACHVVSQLENTRPGQAARVRHPEGAIARRPTIVLTENGALRFVEPLECPTEEVVTEDNSVEVTTGPNLATFVVGVVASAIGGVLTVRGAFDSSAGPYLYGGIAGLAVGLPLAIGPFIGNHKELRAGPPREALHRPGPSEACGDRALAARSATLIVHGIEVHGSIDHDGIFSISPYQLVDAYDTRAIAAWDVAALVDSDRGPRTITTVIEGNMLARYAAAFLAHTDVETRVEPMRLVPGLVPGPLHVSLTSTPEGPALRLVLPLKNEGPGEAWGVRGQVTSHFAPIDGRMLYIGHLAKQTAVARELLIPLTAEAAAALHASDLDISVELRDAYGTAPPVPVRFRGALLVEPR